MVTEKTKYRILVAGGNDRFCGNIERLLPGSIYEPLISAENLGEARRLLMERAVDLLVVNAPLKDGFGTELARDAAEKNLGVLMLVPAESYEQILYRVEEDGVAVLAKPVEHKSFYSAVRLITALRAKLTRLEKKNETLQRKMQDIRTVNRAKWLLIERLGMTESEAHYYIEKQAMDLRLSRLEVAESIIRTYDA